MRKAFIVLTVLLQVMVLAYMAGEREYIVRYGRTIGLRTTPIDPRDLFRGDYVRLNYDISSISAANLPAADSTGINKGQKIYVTLKESSNGLFEFDQAHLNIPSTGIFIAGRSSYEYRHPKQGYPLWLNYGIEAYFVQQGKGLEMEKRLGSRNDVQVPLEMQIALGGSGKAVIKGHRWSPIGMGLQVLRSPPPDTQRTMEPLSAKVALTLANASDAPLALVILPNNCSFSLEPGRTAKKEWVLAGALCGSIEPADDDVVLLQPGRQEVFEIDFHDKRWRVQTVNSEPVEIGALDWTEQFRLIYRPPGRAATGHLKDRAFIWHGDLPSRNFHGRGRID